MDLGFCILTSSQVMPKPWVLGPHLAYSSRDTSQIPHLQAQIHHLSPSKTVLLLVLPIVSMSAILRLEEGSGSPGRLVKTGR